MSDNAANVAHAFIAGLTVGGIAAAIAFGAVSCSEIDARQKRSASQREDLQLSLAPTSSALWGALVGSEMVERIAEALGEADAKDDPNLEISRLRTLTHAAANIFAHCMVESGVCCCGDDMKNHSDPMSCGHAPTDHGAYMVGLWLEEYAKSPHAGDEV